MYPWPVRKADMKYDTNNVHPVRTHVIMQVWWARTLAAGIKPWLSGPGALSVDGVQVHPPPYK